MRAVCCYAVEICSVEATTDKRHRVDKVVSERKAGRRKAQERAFRGWRHVCVIYGMHFTQPNQSRFCGCGFENDRPPRLRYIRTWHPDPNPLETNFWAPDSAVLLALQLVLFFQPRCSQPASDMAPFDRSCEPFYRYSKENFTRPGRRSTARSGEKGG